MKKIRSLIALTAATMALLLSLSACSEKISEKKDITSPDGNLSLTFMLSDGKPYYAVSYKGNKLIDPSALGFQFNEDPSLTGDFEITTVNRSSFDETWETVWGSYSHIRNHYNEMHVDLREKTGLKRELALVFRLYDDGLGFRYVIPEQENLGYFEITDELTEFNFPENNTSWWIIANYDSYEYTHVKSPVSEIGSEELAHLSDYGWPAFGQPTMGAANTPLTMATPKGVYLSIHEAQLLNYAAMTLRNTSSKGKYSLKADLVPWPDGIVKVKSQTPMQSPWRTIQVGDTPGSLIESNLILNLNDPCAFETTDWIKPGKYVGIWWSLHIGKETWNAGPKHGATTENTKKYMDFAARHNIPYVLVEGWNKSGVCGADGSGDADFLQTADVFDIDEITRYGKKLGVRFFAYNETGCDTEYYRNNFDTIFSYYQKMNIPVVKAGHVGDRINHIYHHQSQYGVRYYHELTLKAAEYGISLNIHEPIKSTGLERTYPNLLTKEGVGGMEQCKFDYADPREHTVELPFTRMLAGPMDYMPGLFDPHITGYDEFMVQSTVARQLAMYPIFLSGLQSVTDLIENYENRPEFQFIVDVPVTWDYTTVLNGEIGDFITMVRRSGSEWYLGSMTDESERTLQVPLTFLAEGNYIATIYADGPGADAITNPIPVAISTKMVDKNTVLDIKMAPGGGQAIRFKPAI